jgi:thioredoxin reductase (NADPH)
MRQRAGGSEGPDDRIGSSPRPAAGSSAGSTQPAQAGRSPVLDEAQLEVLRRYGREHDMAARDVLFAAGDVTYDLFVVLAGEVRIIERHGQPGETVLAEDTALGGQAGTSSRIENYLGFPAGLSGEELAARAALQAQKVGVRIKLAAKAVSLSSEAGVHRVRFDDAEAITAKSVIIATGARYNRLPLGRLAEFEGVGVYYAAAQMEAQACRAGPVVIVGGGNSAGQAALFLSRSSSEVHVIIRGDTLETSVSRYLVDQIERYPRIIVTRRTQITALLGKDQLDGVELLDTSRQQTSALAVCGLFVFIGAQPSTQWLAGQLAEDTHGFLLTGSNIPQAQLDDADRMPLFLETSGRESSPSATSAADQSSGPRPQSGRAR